MTLADALRQASAAGLDRLDAQTLLLHALNRPPHDRAWLIAHDSDELPATVQPVWSALLTRRLAGEPVAYLLGQKEFFGLPLQVDARVLVPRPDTETLVQWALDLLPGLGEQPRVIDLGTGSGAIALALAHQRPGLDITASDASPDALAVAQANARALGLRVHFATGHWLEAVPGQTFALIVSNPPYIAEADPHLPALAHEPGSALVSGPDGLDDTRTIIAQSTRALRPGGWLLLEHGHDQAPRVRALLGSAGFDHVSSHTDLAGIERCSGGQWPEGR